MQHLDSLFALAQIVSPNAEEAVQLVEATYRRAFSTPFQPVPESNASEAAQGAADAKPYPRDAERDVRAAEPDPRDAEHVSPSAEQDAPMAAPATRPDPSRQPEDQAGAPREPANFESDEQARIWLFRLMMQIRKETTAPDASVPSVSGAAGASRLDLADLRRRLAEEFVDHALPQAFATLPSEKRVLLMLCEVERMSCADAGRVLGIDPTIACARLEEARISLHRVLNASASEVERHLIETGLPSNWKRSALQRMAESRLVMLPPTLRPSVVSIFKGVSQLGSADTSAIENGAETAASVDRPWAGLLKKFAAVLTIIVFAGLLGYGFTKLTRHEPNLSLIALSAQQAESVGAIFETTSAEQAERYIYDRLGSRVTLPTIAEAPLHGVSIRSVVENAEVPVILFQDAATNLPITVYVYSYAFLDRHRKDLVLERDILRQIESQGNFDLHDLGDEKALVWRNRDDIFIAITSGDADALRDRIAFPS